MNPFVYVRGQLMAEGVPVRALAQRFGTPLYVYSRTHLVEQFQALAAALEAARPLICFSVKVNTNAAVIRTFADLGAGADVVSGGELYRARAAGVPASRIVFAGVGKTREEIQYALREGILFFTVESEPELERIAACARALKQRARVALRVNPDVDPETHQFISTGKKENKFGMDLRRAERAYERALRERWLEVVGLHMHIGSQILSPAPYVRALERVRDLCLRMQERCSTFRYLDMGGGMGIPYRPDQHPFDLGRFSRALIPLLNELGLQLVLEPGRFLVGNGGILVTEVQYVKEGPDKKFVIVDAGMNDLIRPPLYQAHHEILPVKAADGQIRADVVGPICESSDFLALDREMTSVKPGDLLAVMSAGAYGFSMASNYNSRGRAAEVMVWKDRYALIRRRETYEDLIRSEVFPPRFQKV